MLVKIKLTKAAKTAFIRSDLAGALLRGEKTIKQIPFGTRTLLSTYYEYAFWYNKRIHNYDEYIKVWEQLSLDMQQRHTQDQAKTLFYIFTHYYNTLPSSYHQKKKYDTLLSAYHQKKKPVNTEAKRPFIRISDPPPNGQASGRCFFTQAMNIPNLRETDLMEK